MAEVMEVVLPVGIGFGDGLSDAAIEYIDVVTGKTAEPVYGKPSTWTHVAISAATGLASYFVFRGSSRIISAMVAGRHLGKVTADLAKEAAEAAAPPAVAGVGGKLKLGGGKVRLEVTGAGTGKSTGGEVEIKGIGGTEARGKYSVTG